MPETAPPDLLRQAMRHWPSGVAIATSRWGDVMHGMTVNSFISQSLDPPIVSVTMANATRTYELVRQSGVYAVTLLSSTQQDLADRFAGKVDDDSNRMAGADWFTLISGAPLLTGGTAYLDCKVIYMHDLGKSTLFLAEVSGVRLVIPDLPPLAYYNRRYCEIETAK